MSNRIARLEELGVIRGYRADLDPDVIAGECYLVTLTAAPRAAYEVARHLGELAYVERAALLSGGRVYLHARMRPPRLRLRDLHADLAEVPEINGYDVAQELDILAQRPPELDASGVEVPCHHCGGPIQGTPGTARINDHAHVFCCDQCRNAFQDRHDRLADAAGLGRPR